MDSSKKFLGAEGSSSSESGWTMYLASPMHDEDTYQCSNEDDNNNTHNEEDDDDDDSDDSMASDASSGPGYPIHIAENGGGYRGMNKYDKGNIADKYSSHKQAEKQEKKRGENNGKKKENEDLKLKAKTTAAPVQRGAR